MKHYFIYRKGNDSEKLAKSQREQRKIIKHYHCQEECNEVTEIEQADEGVTEEDIRRCYAGDEAQHVVERKEENGYEPNPTDANQNTSTIYYRPLKRWIEVTLEQKRDWERFVGAIRKAKKAIRKAFENSMAGKGTSIVEFVSTCSSGWKMTPEKANKWMEENMFPFYPLGDLKNKE